jgi:Leucine-rich repeat (LRR) protein
MIITDLQKQLEEAYTIRNLNNISLTLINLYKNQQYSILQKIGEIISDFVNVEISTEGKGFSKLIMLYHPDRSNYYLKEIKRLVDENNFDGLLEFSHILKLERIEEISNSLNSYEDIDYSPVYDWDIETDGFTIIHDNDKKQAKTTSKKTIEYDFYNAIKMRQYGHVDVEFPSYYLEDIDEFELSSCYINDLDGVQFCIHAKTMDLSDNMIVDLSPINGLERLEELNLADNLIGDIDALGNLVKLKSVNLSNNRIEDISPLLELENLEYVDLTGNPILSEQMKMLTDLEIKVDY